MSYEVMRPVTGELVDLSQFSDEQITAAVVEIRRFEGECRRFKAAAADVIAERLAPTNRKSMEAGDFHVALGPEVERRFDIDRLTETLGAFVDKGVLTREAAQRCVRLKKEAVWSEIKRLLDNSQTAPEISLCFEEVPVSSRTLTIKER